MSLAAPNDFPHVVRDGHADARAHAVDVEIHGKAEVRGRDQGAISQRPRSSLDDDKARRITTTKRWRFNVGQARVARRRGNARDERGGGRQPARFSDVQRLLTRLHIPAGVGSHDGDAVFGEAIADHEAGQRTVEFGRFVDDGGGVDALLRRCLQGHAGRKQKC